MSYSCFVILPIGDEGTAIRQNADDLVDLVITQALQKYDFQVVRADKLTTAGSISSQVVRLIQQSDLCIIDISGKNTEIMYECGRRHETGKPCVMMAKKGETLPFDVDVPPTIFYDLQTPRSVHDSVVVLQNAITKMIADGFTPNNAGNNLVSAMEVLGRIERKIGSLSTAPSVAPVAAVVNAAQAEPAAQATPTLADAFASAMREGNIGYAESLLPRIKDQVDEDRYFDSYVEPLASRGSELCAGLLVERLSAFASLPNDDRRQDCIGSLVTYYNKKDLEAEGIEKLAPVIDAAISEGQVSSEYKAFMLNQKHRLLVGLGRERYGECVDIMREVVELKPDNGSYRYNLAYLYYATGDLENAEQEIGACLELDAKKERGFDADHIELAIIVCDRFGKAQKATDLLAQYKANNPQRYEMFVSARGMDS